MTSENVVDQLIDGLAGRRFSGASSVAGLLDAFGAGRGR
ncbi:hypothetical protein SHIRM173S_03905 [Streptomyces hirsutus]